MQIDERHVAELAYARFLARGGEHGHDVEDWIAAEQEAARVPVDVVLVEPGPNTIELVRVLRELTGLPLPEIRRAIDSVPRVIKRCSRGDAQAFLAAIEPLGARVEVTTA